MQRTNIIKNDGFTIAEVLIASTVFSLILVMVIVSILSFSNHYYKSSNIASAQSSARTILSDVTSAIEYNTIGTPISGTITGSPTEYYICAGSIEFYFFPNRPQSNTKDAIWEDNNLTSCNTTTYISPSSTSEVLLGYGEALTDLTVGPSIGGANLFPVTVSVAYYGGSSTTTNNSYCGTNGANCSTTLTQDVEMRYVPQG